MIEHDVERQRTAALRVSHQDETDSMIDGDGVMDELSTGDLVKLFAFAFGNGVLLSSYLIITLPIESKRISKKDSAVYLAAFVVIAGITQLICPVIGLYSDRCRHRWGRRRPFILYGGILGVVGLMFQYFSQLYELWMIYVIAFMVSMFSLNIIYSSMNGLIPDFVPERQVGRANGIIAMLSVLGAVSSFCVYRILANVSAFYWFYIIVISSTVATTFFAANRKDQRPLPASYGPVTLADIRNAFYISPVLHRDFFLILVSRTLYYMGISSQTFLMYYLRDVLSMSDEESEEYTGTLAVIGQCCGVLTAFPVGYLSDKLSNGRKRYIYVSCVLLAIGNIAFIGAKDQMAVVLITCLIGAANGMYLSMDGSLAVDALPSKDEAARFMGIWGVGAFLGASLGPIIGGPVLRMNPDPVHDGRYTLMGYTILLCLSAIYLLASGYVLKFVKVD
mmetsp:Transcript_16931/g.27413  ORF Transcript_16931/g.27413 Transcript_16931/m.27413 type:complete len:449 (-) Transcript_16931:37-1383(-)|eukprot:CAMPEP_0203777450 /NCGR_PEP_ID=MMETSP0099_2-20121227/7386_1 /ASSEMBLY_ACC=CAM_ASM_000209 /TAXON_ID=96639 /ORGANISM=" , Strain NY0313808BC1" /LENGTH=448 /DNA_ID=CAMNT_0050676725 /DNA_START=574 /DNA_END=1920 /DNA_ORIENTATION=+